MKVEIHVSEKNEGTESPWWILIDPSHLRAMFEGVAKHGEIPDEDRILTAIAHSIEGPYFSREEAEDYLKSRRYAYSEDAKVWCHSGYRTTQYRMAIKVGRSAAAQEMPNAKSE